MALKLLEKLGASVLALLFFIGDVLLMLRHILGQLTGKIRTRHILEQMSHLGVNTLPIVSLTMLFTGMVMTLQMAGELIKFGAESTIGGVVAIAMGRELAPVLVAVVSAGRVGSAMTAEISTMKVTEQIDALRVMGIDPLGYLAVPRMLACMLMIPLLTVFGNAIGVLGGWLVAGKYFHITDYVYWHSIVQYANGADLYGGLIKAIIFGMVIALLGCYYGMRAPAGAEGVGRATTKSVVSSIIAIFFLNVFMSWLLY